MTSVIIFALSCFVLIGAQAQTTPTPDCAEQLDKTYECVEKIRTSADAQALDKKRDGIFLKCVTNLPPQCAAIKKAGDQCQENIAKDTSMQSLRVQIKQNVSKCFERFSSNSRNDSPMAGGFRPGPPVFFAGGQPQAPPPQPPPPGGPFPGQGPGPNQDPCTPSESQMRCIKTEMRKDVQAHEMAEKLEDKQRDCYNTTEATNDTCRMDGNPQLRDCVERAKQPMMQSAMSKLQECMQAALGGSSSAPRVTTNS